jgi:hypothetical protein
MGSADRPLPDSPCARPAHRHMRSRWLWAAALVVILAAGGLTAAHLATAPGPSPRDRRWQRGIAYLARKLPADRAAGLGPVSQAAWNASAARLEAEVPRLTDGQVIVGMARMVAMLQDGETRVVLPVRPLYPLQAEWLGGGLYLLAVPAAERSLLGTRLLAVDGQPVAQILARISPVIDSEDAQLRSDEELGALNDADLLHWLGITRSPTAASFTVETAAGHQRTVRLKAQGTGDLSYYNWLAGPGAGLARVPLPLYLQHSNLPYWLRVLPAQHAVYLKYNQCLSDDGFQQLAARALSILRANPGDRLIVDLRGNGGGDSGPFSSLITGIQGDPAINQPGRVIGLVDDFTDSSATADAGSLALDTQAVLIGTGPADPIGEYGNDEFFRLPESGLDIEYTSAIFNPGHTPTGVPNIRLAPTLHQVLTGDDPVLAAALSYQSPAG